MSVSKHIHNSSFFNNILILRSIKGLILLANIVSFIQCFDPRLKDNTLPIFQPFPLLKIQAQELCQNATATNIVQFRSNSRFFLAVNMMQCGMFIYDITQPSQSFIAYQKPFLDSKGSVTSLSITHSQKYMWIGYLTGTLEILDLSSIQFPLISSTIIKNESKSDVVNKVFHFQDPDLLFLACLNNIKLVALVQNDLTVIKIIKLQDSNILRVKLAFKKTLLVASGSSSVHFFSYQVDQQQQQFNKICSFRPSQAYLVSSFEVIQDKIIVVQVIYSQFIMIDIEKYIQSYDGTSCNVSLIVYLDKYPSLPLGSTIHISKDNRFLFSLQRSLGVYIFDLSKQMFEIFQVIPIDGDCTDLQISDDENFLFQSNQFSVYIFEKTIPNLNLDTPNLLINQFQQVTYSSFKPPEGSIDSFMIYQEPQNNLYMARKDKGSATLSYKGSGILEDQSFVQNNMPNISNAYEAFVPNTSLMYLAKEALGLDIYDYKDVTTPVNLKSNLKFGLSYVKFEVIVFNSKGTICFLANIINIVILDIKDPLLPVVITLIDTLTYTGDQTLFRFILSNDEKKLYVNPSSYGIIVVDVQDIKNPKFLQKYFLGKATHIQQTQDSEYLVCGSAFMGVFVFKLIEEGKITLISKVKLSGVIMSINLIYNDNYLLVSTIENCSTNLVSIVDKKNPILIQTLSTAIEDSLFYIQTSRDNSYAFVSGFIELHLLFLQSPLIFHTQMYQLQPIPNSNQFRQVSIPKEQPLLIGQQIEIYLMSIYQKKEFKIVKALYYTNYDLQILPYWMQFQLTKKVLKLQVSKDSFQGDESGYSVTQSLQQVVFLSYQQLKDNEFVNSYLDINQVDSKALKQACLSLGYLDKQGYVSENYSPQNNFSFGSSDQQIQYLQKWSNQPKRMKQVIDFIKFTLNQNIINHVLQFYTQKSLVINFDGIQNPITSNQQLVVVTLKTNHGRFVNKSYSGILVVISAEQDLIGLQGSVSSINSILLQKIKLSLPDPSIEKQVLIEVQIDDSINFKYIKILNLSESNFISLQSPVLLIESLQQDFNQQYKNSEIAIQTNFVFQISQSDFQCTDSDVLTFKVKISIDGEDFKDIPTGFWLSFSSNERTFAGTPPSSVFSQQYTILVNATDGYTSAQDKFQLNVSIIPFFILFQLFLQILGPVIGVLGFWKYRAVFYNTIFKSNYIYTKEVAYVGISYEKTITITDDTLSIAIKLWENIRKQIPVQEVLRQMEMMLCEIKTNSPKLTNIESVLLKNNESATLQEELFKSIHAYGIDQTEVKYLNTQLKKVYEDHVIQTPEMKSIIEIPAQQLQLSKVNSTINSPSAKFIGDNQNLLFKSQKLIRKRTSSQFEQNARRYTKSIVKEVTDKVQKILQIVENEEIKNFKLFQADGSVNISHIISQIVSKETALPEQKQTLPQMHLTAIKDPHSMLQIMIKGLAAEYFVECSPMCNYIITSLKKKAMIIYQDIDWYRAYINTCSTLKDDQKDTFPKYLLNKVSIGLALEEIIQDIQQKFSKGKNTHMPFIKKDIIESNRIKEEILSYISLIEDYLQAKALGISKFSRKYFQVTQGECLHCNPCRIRSIKTFQKGITYDYCVSFQNFFGTNQVEKGLSENQLLPDWLTIDFKKSIITLKGTPDIFNIGSTETKIYDIDGYLLRSFELQVLPDKGQQAQENQQQEFLKLSLLSEQDLQVKRQKNSIFDRNISHVTKNIESKPHSDENLDEGNIMFYLQNRAQNSNSKNQQHITRLFTTKENQTTNFEDFNTTNEQMNENV